MALSSCWSNNSVLHVSSLLRNNELAEILRKKPKFVAQLHCFRDICSIVYYSVIVRELRTIYT